MNIQNILYKSIQASEKWKYRVDGNDDILKKSLKVRGILSPLVILQEKNQFLLLDGFKRYHYIKDKSDTKIPAYLYSKEQVKDAFLHSLLLNETNRPLSTIEKSNVIKLIQIFNDEDFRNKVYNFLDIPAKQQFIQKYLTINSFNETVKKYFHNFQFSLRQIERISPLAIDALLPWIELAQYLNLKAQEFITMVETIWDISINEKIPINDLYNKLHIKDQLNTQLTIQQKTYHLKNFLNQERYPLLNAIRKKMSEQINKIQKENNIPIQISWDKSLEQSGLWFKTYLEHEKSLDELIRVFNSPETKTKLINLFKILMHSLEDSNETT